jgi:hypothetical protein
MIFRKVAVSSHNREIESERRANITADWGGESNIGPGKKTTQNLVSHGTFFCNLSVIEYIFFITEEKKP